MSLICPICKSALAIIERTAQCENKHSFDRAKEGYFNLLPVQNKNSLNPGDDADMVAARTAFLDAAYYQPFLNALTEIIEPASVKHFVDSGCGEGWYTTALAKLSAKTTAFDISKNAIRRAAKRDKSIQWLVASSGAIPLQSESADAMLSIFSPVTPNEAARVLSVGGLLIIAAPGERHLWQLREALYESVRPHQAEKWFDELADHFEFIEEKRAHFDVVLDRNEQLLNLLKMTPHYWRAPRERRAQVEALSSFSTEADFRMLCFKKKADA